MKLLSGLLIVCCCLAQLPAPTSGAGSGGGSSSSSTTCLVTQSASTITFFAAATASTPCRIPIGATGGKTFSAPILLTLPSGGDTWWAGMLPAGTVAVGANSATATCVGCAGGVTQTGITSIAGLDPDAVALASFVSVSTSFTSITPLEGSIPGSYPITGGTGVTCTNSGILVTCGLANTAVTPASYTNTSLTVDAQGRITAASSGSAAPSTLRLFGNCSGPSGLGTNLVSIDSLGGSVASGSCAGAAFYYFGTPIETACTLQNLTVNVGIASITGGDGVVTVYDTDAAGAATTSTGITVTMGTTNTQSDNTHTYAITKSHYVWIKVNTTSAVPTHWAAALECK